MCRYSSRACSGGRQSNCGFPQLIYQCRIFHDQIYSLCCRPAGQGTMGEAVKIKLLALGRSASMNSPSGLPQSRLRSQMPWREPVSMMMRSRRPKWSTVPLPAGPNTPSPMGIIYHQERRCIDLPNLPFPEGGARSPSMLNTPSVMMSRLPSTGSCSSSLRCAISMWRNTLIFAPDKRQRQ